MNFRTMMSLAIAGALTACSANISVNPLNAATDSSKTSVVDSSGKSPASMSNAINAEQSPPSQGAVNPSQETTTSGTESKPPEDPRSDRSPWQTIKPNVAEGQTYNEQLRQFILSSGWEPVVDPNCKQNVGGGAAVCNERPEVSACSGDGYCIMRFQHRVKDVAVKIGTYGDRIRYAEFTRRKSRLVETSTATCPSQNFTNFLAAFASDKAIRNQFTLPQIRVTTLIETERGGYGNKVVSVSKEQYNDFTIVYKNGAFYNVDSEGKAISDALIVSPERQADISRLNVVPQGDDYFVKTRVGVSEGNSWLFKRNGDCWSLAEDPEPPSP
jgi:hypothetical protein